MMLEPLPVALFCDLQQDSTWLERIRSAASAASPAAKKQMTELVTAAAQH